MVKIRLRRMGNRHRPFYRIVVAKSTAPRNGKFNELLGTYDPLKTPSEVKLNKERALYWLMTGAQPTETVAYLLKREGVLQEFFSKRPKAESKYKFLDKRTATMSKESVVQEAPVAPAPVQPTVEAAPTEPPPVPVEAAPQAEEPVAPSAEAEKPVEKTESAPAEEASDEPPAAEEQSSEKSEE